MKTPEKTPNVMEALDAGLEQAGLPEAGIPTAAADEEPMPMGSEQLDESEGAGSPAHWRFRRMAYTSTLIGLLLLPVALLLRTGRWSARVLMAHDRGWEFGPW